MVPRALAASALHLRAAGIHTARKRTDEDRTPLRQPLVILLLVLLLVLRLLVACLGQLSDRELSTTRTCSTSIAGTDAAAATGPDGPAAPSDDAAARHTTSIATGGCVCSTAPPEPLNNSVYMSLWLEGSSPKAEIATR